MKYDCPVILEEFASALHVSKETMLEISDRIGLGTLPFCFGFQKAGANHSFADPAKARAKRKRRNASVRAKRGAGA